MKHRKKWFLVFLLAGIILMMVPFSIAYLTHVETRENRITIGQNNVMIEEDFTPPDFWKPNTVYDGPLQYRLSDACGNEREPDNDWTEQCHDRRGFHTSGFLEAKYGL